MISDSAGVLLTAYSLPHSGACTLPLPRQLAQAADHQLGPRRQQVVEALDLQLGSQPALRLARPWQQRSDGLALPLRTERTLLSIGIRAPRRSLGQGRILRGREQEYVL